MPLFTGTIEKSPLARRVESAARLQIDRFLIHAVAFGCPPPAPAALFLPFADIDAAVCEQQNLPVMRRVFHIRAPADHANALLPTCRSSASRSRISSSPAR